MGASASKENNHLLKTTFSEEEGKDYDGVCAFLLGCTHLFSAVLKTALELHLFEVIAKGASSFGASMSASEISSRFPNQRPEMPQRLECMLRLLASHSLLTCSTRNNKDGGVERVYGITPVAQYFYMMKVGLLTKFLNHQAITEVL
ncbi:hypothetical protein L6164_000996 [Bauhinia variegata]|uniref:Uncharacterized protein n=1 Tax=Bauhinia variegata TaxID=167791 RepID=A0ACB9Q8F9_BAUVA|nr:hypothetical protein L6164_000996 [Bauhinia variegata]